MKNLKLAKAILTTVVIAGVFYLNMNFLVTAKGADSHLGVTPAVALADDGEGGGETGQYIIVNWTTDDKTVCNNCWCTETWVEHQTCPSGGTSACTPFTVARTGGYRDPQCPKE